MDSKSSRKIIAFVVLTAVVFFSTVCVASVRHEEKSRKTIALEGENCIVAQSKSGDITIKGEMGRSEVSLEVIKRVKAENREEAERLAGLMKVEITRAGGKLIVKTKYPKGAEVKKSIFSYLLQRCPRMSIDIRLAVPLELAVEVKTASGDVSVSDISGSVKVTAASGDAEISNIGSFLDVTVASGDIEVAKVAKRVGLCSASGDISAREIAGDAEISTASGDIELVDLGGNLQLETASG
ncbi:MAG: DUF4097 family beta strand repeat protein, partial [Candidatus Krumholzibacteria bacterium]|nr:DUF4097 family beta strand repeat protein [Candidatus Krumholzibacteria bacterium]